jgi:hypothetical protein
MAPHTTKHNQAQPSLHADSPVEGGSHDVVSCAPTVQADVRVPTAVSPLRSVPAARSIYSLAGSSKQYCQRPLSAFQCTKKKGVTLYYSFHQTL